MLTSLLNSPRSARRPSREATELRALELARLDGMNLGLWPAVEAGSPPAVSAAVRVSERRAKLLGLDEPTATRTELSGSLSVTAQTRLKAEAEELRWLSFDELKTLAEASDKLISDAIALVKARRTPMLVGAAPAPVAGVDDVATGESPGTDVNG